AGEDLHRGRLPGAVLAQVAEALALLHLERDPAQSLDGPAEHLRPEGLVEVPALDDVRHALLSDPACPLGRPRRSSLLDSSAPAWPMLAATQEVIGQDQDEALRQART